MRFCVFHESRFFHLISTQKWQKSCLWLQLWCNDDASGCCNISPTFRRLVILLFATGRATANRRKEAPQKWQEVSPERSGERKWKKLVKYGAKSLALFFAPTLSSYYSYSPQLLLSNTFFLSQGHGPDSSNSFMCTKEWRLLQPLDFGGCTMPLINWG